MNGKNYWKLRQRIGNFIGYSLLIALLLYFIINLLKAIL